MADDEHHIFQDDDDDEHDDQDDDDDEGGLGWPREDRWPEETSSSGSRPRRKWEITESKIHLGHAAESPQERLNLSGKFFCKKPEVGCGGS